MGSVNFTSVGGSCHFSFTKVAHETFYVYMYENERNKKKTFFFRISVKYEPNFRAKLVSVVSNAILLYLYIFFDIL